MKAEEFDRKFDAGEDITQMLDLSNAKRHQSEQKTISIDLPVWMLELIDQEASRLGVSPQSIIQTSLAEHLKDPAQPRTPGLLTGQLGDAFFEPLPEEEIQLWE